MTHHSGSLFRLPVLAALAALVAAGSVRAQNPEFDVLGLRAGMTEAEARAVLATHSPTQIRPDPVRYRYSDGVQQHNTEAFPLRLIVMIQRPAERSGTTLNLFFSGPPDAPRLVGVTRDEVNAGNPPSRQLLIESLKEKYGTPALELDLRGSDGRFLGQTLVWDEPGRPQCVHDGLGTVNSFGVTSVLDARVGSVIEFLRSERDASATLRDAIPGEFTQCGVSVVYTIGQSDPVDRFSATLIDVGARAAAELATQAWLDQLEAEARATRAREAGGARPQL